MKKIQIALLSLLTFSGCSESEGDPLWVNYYFNITYDSVSVFSYDNYSLDSLVVSDGNLFNLPFSVDSFFFIDSLFMASDIYERDVDYFFDYGNGDIDTVITTWRNSDIKIYFNDTQIFSIDNESSEDDLINRNRVFGDAVVRSNAIIFQCEKKDTLSID